jgi:HSP20 family protein
MSTLTTWNPFREMEAVQRRFSTLFGRSMTPGNGEESLKTAEWTPLVDVTETDKEFTIKAEIPDVKKEDVKVTVQDGTLHISGERKFEKEEKNKKYHRIERAYGSFERVFILPEAAKPDQVRAEFHDGLLEVHLPKGEPVKTQAIEVKVS